MGQKSCHQGIPEDDLINLSSSFLRTQEPSVFPGMRCCTEALGPGYRFAMPG
jgi:hypothetical protein